LARWVDKTLEQTSFKHKIKSRFQKLQESSF